MANHISSTEAPDPTEQNVTRDRRPRRPRLGSIYRRKKKMPDGSIVELPTLWIKFYRDRHPIRESAQTTSYREAEQKLKTRIKEIQDGTFCGPKAERLRISDLLDGLLTDYQVNQKSYRDFADPAVRLHVRPYFGSMRARELDTPRVQAYQLQRRKEGAANATINRECSLLRRAFNLGCNRRHRPRSWSLTYRGSGKITSERDFWSTTSLRRFAPHCPRRYDQY